MQAIKKVKNAVLYDNGCIRIDNVRGSYVHAAKPYKNDNDGDDKPGKFSMVALLPKSTHAEAKALIAEAIEKMLKEKNKGQPIKSDAKFLRNGDDAGKPECQGMWTVNCSEARRPACRDARGNLVSDLSEVQNTFLSGYWFNVLIRPWWQDNKYGKKVNAGFVGIQFVKKDKPFGEGAIDDTEAWDVVESDDDGMGGDDDI